MSERTHTTVIEMHGEHAQCLFCDFTAKDTSHMGAMSKLAAHVQLMHRDKMDKNVVQNNVVPLRHA